MRDPAAVTISDPSKALLDTQLGDSEGPVTRHEDGSVTVRLFKPIVTKRETIDVIKLRAVQALHLQVMDDVKGDVKKQLRLISELSGRSVSDVQQLSGRDYSVINDELQVMMGKSPATGETS